MKSLFVLLFFSVTLFCAPLQWSHDYLKALSDAKKEHKLIYVLIISDTCGWCKKFEKTTLQNTKIRERVNKEFVTVLLSRDRHAIPKFLKTSPVPRHYFLDETGKILYASLGYRDEEMFNAFMDNAQEHYEILKDENYETSKDR
ncbi:DUF255 domain-containing protein [Sulfurimonas sp. ST-27]|uniref:DUF255 domain-containing protein n=1 Tax=Sulfurimonas sp. ST-27 TaxID=3400152 RepID=UPI003AB553C9